MKNKLYALMATGVLLSVSLAFAMDDGTDTTKTVTKRVPIKGIPKELTAEMLHSIKDHGSLLTSEGEYIAIYSDL